jgi:hypothetical protein
LTNKGTTSEVLADWGPTARDIAIQVAAAKKLEVERAQAAATAATAMAAAAAANKGTTATQQQQAGNASNSSVSGVATGSLPPSGGTDGVNARPALAIGPRTGSQAGGSPMGLSLPSTGGTGLGLSTGIGTPSRLGGPKTDAGDTHASGGKTEFLRAVHAAACRNFGTVLGPEANAAHRNHFHVDMAERKFKNICE